MKGLYEEVVDTYTRIDLFSVSVPKWIRVSCSPLYELGWPSLHGQARSMLAEDILRD